MIFDGQSFAEKKEIKLKSRVAQFRQRGITPKLVSILADQSKETELYVSLKAKFAEKVGIVYDVHRFDGTQTPEIIDFINKANTDLSIHGIMVQLPVANEQEIVRTIAPEKDVDCLAEENLGLVMIGQPRFLPATVRAVLEILAYALEETESREIVGRWLAGKSVCVIGASVIVGKPLAILLSDLGATVTLCRSTTSNLAETAQRADILVSATGVSELITREMVKPGAIVIDVGISKLLREGRFRVMGDVDRRVLEKTSFFTPVPGGVGPVTVACLFENLLDALEL